MSGRETLDAMRADTWLWAARLFKTRPLAAAACAGGRVQVNDQTAKPARLVRPGDLVRVSLPIGKRTVKILGLAGRRGPAAAARTLYDDLTPPAPPTLRIARPPYRPPGAGRPTKRERRLIDRFRSPG